jgi:hypothetical protein
VLDKLLQRAAEWITSHGASAPVFTPQPEKPPEAEEGRFVVLTRDLVDDTGHVVCESGARLPLCEWPGREIGCIHNGVAYRLTEDQYQLADNGAGKPKMVQLIKPVPGGNNEADKLYQGAEFEVVRWVDNQPVIKSASGREHHLADDEWESL